MARTACRITKSSLPSAQRPGTPEPHPKRDLSHQCCLGWCGNLSGSGKKELLVGSSKHKEVPGKLLLGQLTHTPSEYDFVCSVAMFLLKASDGNGSAVGLISFSGVHDL